MQTSTTSREPRRHVAQPTGGPTCARTKAVGIGRNSPVRSGASAKAFSKAETSLEGESKAKQSPSIPVRTLQRICRRSTARRQLAIHVLPPPSLQGTLAPPTPQELPTQCLIAGHSASAQNLAKLAFLHHWVSGYIPRAARRTRAVVAGFGC